MFVEGRHNFLNNKNLDARPKEKKASKESFEDMLSKTQKKSMKSKKKAVAPKTQPKKKPVATENHEMQDRKIEDRSSKEKGFSNRPRPIENKAQVTKVSQDQPMKKNGPSLPLKEEAKKGIEASLVNEQKREAKGENQKAQPSLLKGVSLGKPVQQSGKLDESKDLKLQGELKNPLMMDKKMTQLPGKSQQTPASLKSSELQKKTLAGLEKNLSQKSLPLNKGEGLLVQNAMTNSLEASPVKAGALSKSMLTKIQPQQGMLKPKMAVSQMNKMKALKSLESLSSEASLQALSKDAPLSEASNILTDEEAGSSFENMMGPMVDPENSQVQTEARPFSEELMIGAESDKSEKVENMQSIIKQARTFVKDGGGEMQIHLQPEGLGKVHLKVAVQDGQVAVEMQADNMLAKKALEEGLVDIKQALEGQKLLVETLKVEMAPDYQKDFSDLANHMQEQANRDFAEQFLGQFRQEREERFGGLFDSFRNFQPGSSEPELSLSKRNPYTEKGKGRTVNLVA